MYHFFFYGWSNIVYTGNNIIELESTARSVCSVIIFLVQKTQLH